MDAPNSTSDQEAEGDQQPSALPIVCEKDNSQETSDHALMEAEIRHTWAIEPFRPILKVLEDLERDDPKFAFPAARLVGLYRRLWDSCVSKHIDGQKLDQSNRISEEASRHLTKERDGLQLRHDKQLSRLRFFEQALESSRVRLTRVLDDWDHPSRLNLPGFLDNAREE